jgi:hypothetical protein
MRVGRLEGAHDGKGEVLGYRWKREGESWGFV